MKKVKLFLTVCTICLGVAAVASTKANGKIIQKGYIDNPATGVCDLYSGTDCNGGTIACVVGTTQLYQQDNSNPCSVPLTKQ